MQLDAAHNSEIGDPDAAIVVTGICGRLGKRLARQLHRRARVIGVDRRDFPERPRDIEHHALDVLSKRAK
ncbi:hypothetical protein, partial [Salmonella sp. SAL4446]|uniref:hypothetical protein n=1 Tax=Salmonella sp. SAL4446 TaxID=3159901 RepID=UPI003979184F